MLYWLHRGAGIKCNNPFVSFHQVAEVLGCSNTNNNNFIHHEFLTSEPVSPPGPCGPLRPGAPFNEKNTANENI